MAPSLLDAKLLSFDVYATLINWEPGIVSACSPLLSRLDPKPSNTEFLQLFTKLENQQQVATPTMKYNELLSTVYLQICDIYKSRPESAEAEAEAVGNSIKDWEPFPDTVDALKRLKKFYKLVVLSNVDNESFFKQTLPMLGGDGVFDLILTAEDIGSYKPDLNNFHYMIKKAEELGVKKEEICITAMSLTHDHVPGKKLGLLGSFIDRKGAVMGIGSGPENAEFDWRFATLGEMADAAEKEAAEKGVA